MTVGSDLLIEWRNTLQNGEKKGDKNVLFPVMSVFTENYDQKPNNPPYDRKNVEAALQGSGLTCQPIDAYLPTYFAYFVRSGFLQVPSDTSTQFAKEFLTNMEKMDLITRTSRSHVRN